MTTINVSNLILKLQQKIDSTSTEADRLYYSKAIQQLRTGNVFSVASFANLPNATQNPGVLYYVQDDETVYFSSVFGWINPSKDVYNMFSWGSNFCGVLGDGTTVSRCSPVREISSSIDWCQVSTGEISSFAIKTSGQLWGWGQNACGEIGDGTTTNRCSPVREISSSIDWCQVSGGVFHTAAVKTSGQIWSWGSGGDGQLGNGTVFTNRCSPVREFCSATDWCQVSVGFLHTAAVKTSGELWTWGQNSCGRLGDGTITSRSSPVRERCSATDWCQVSVGDRHTAAVKTSGQIWSWGFNLCTELGDGTTVDKCSPVREFCSATDWCQVSAGCAHTAAIKTSGQIWAWGCHGNGRLGDGTTLVRCSPVREISSATDWCQVSAACSTFAIKMISV